MIQHEHEDISESAVSQSDTHAAYTMDIVDIHVHATIYLYTLLSCILFQEIQLAFIEVTFCWWHVYFYEHISGVWSVIKFRWSTIDVTRQLCLNGCGTIFILPLHDTFLTDCHDRHRYDHVPWSCHRHRYDHVPCIHCLHAWTQEASESAL